MRRTDNIDKEAGFTLAELMVAMAVFSLLAVALTGGISFGSRAWERTRSANSEFEKTEIALDAIRTWLASAHPVSDVTSDRRVTAPLVGSDQRLTLSAPLARDGLDDGLYRITLAHDAQTGSLTARWVPNRAGQIDPADVAEAARRILLSGIEEAGFSYFEPGPVGGAGRWVERWTDRRDLPVAIALNLTFENGLKRSVIARTRINKEADCRFDPVSRDCR